MAAPSSQHRRGINVAMELLVARRCNIQAVWWWQAWWRGAPLCCLKDRPHRWNHVDELAHPLRLGQLRRRSISLEAAWRPAPSNRLAQPIGLRPSVGIWPAESRVVPERWAGAREPLPAPASGLAAATPPVHCRRAARPPSLLTTGPEGARLSALSLPDPHPALARAGVILAAAAARRPPAFHRLQPEPTSLGVAAAAAAAVSADAATAAAAAAAASTIRHRCRHRHPRHHRCRGGKVRSCPTWPPNPPTPAAVMGWRRGWGGCRLPQALAAVPAVLSGCLARRRLQLPSSRASQDLKKGCSDKLNAIFFGL